jgi:hypothetical protein
MSPRDRVLVGLRVAGDLSYAEIGAVIGASEHAAMTATRRAVQRLRAIPPPDLQPEILIVGERNLASVLAEYTAHYNGHRPHRSLGQQPPNPPPQVVDLNAARVQRRPILGGLINEYTQAA